MQNATGPDQSGVSRSASFDHRFLFTFCDAVALALSRLSVTRREKASHLPNRSTMLLCKQTALVCLLLCALSSRTTAQNPTSTAQNDPFDRDLLREDVKCVRIPLKKCLPILQYNYTAFPNLLQQRRAQEAQRDFDVTSRLLSLTTGCSDFMIFFVCSMYAPFCQVDELRGDRVLPPCRNMCESARRGCEGLMRRYRFTWPDEFDCERLPEWDGSDKCAGVNDTELAKAAKQLRDRNRGFAPTVDLPTFQTPPIETTGRTADDLCPQPLRVNASRNDYTFGGHKVCALWGGRGPAGAAVLTAAAGGL